MFFTHMGDTLLPSPASQECDCKWIWRLMVGSVIRIDIPRDTVSLDCNIKSMCGHTSIHMTPWHLQSQYKMWHSEWYLPRDHTQHQKDALHAVERHARASALEKNQLTVHCQGQLGAPSLVNRPHAGKSFPIQVL